MILHISVLWACLQAFRVFFYAILTKPTLFISIFCTIYRFWKPWHLTQSIRYYFLQNITLEFLVFPQDWISKDPDPDFKKTLTCMVFSHRISLYYCWHLCWHHTWAQNYSSVILFSSCSSTLQDQTFNFCLTVQSLTAKKQLITAELYE